jgi:hypothetical protein
MNILIRIFLLLLVSLQSTAWHSRYVVDAPIRWHSSTNMIGFRIQPSSFPVGSPFRSGLLAAMATLNQNPSLIRVKADDDSEWVSVSNGVNEIWFTDNNLVTQGAPALCVAHFNPFAFGVWPMTEADVIFNSNSEPYTVSRNSWDTYAYNGPSRPLQTTALHELGHALGMQHENSVYNIMGQDWTHVNRFATMLIPSLGEDVNVGLMRLYGPNPSVRPDLTVTNFKYSGSNGEYSTHSRTELKAAITGETVTRVADPLNTTEPNQDLYWVKPGQLITVEFTFENDGRDSITSANAQLLFSTNRTITTADRPLLTQRIPMRIDRPLTRTFLIRVPAEAVPATHAYIGVIVDSDNAVAEAREINNTSYIPVFILNP